MMRRVVLLLPLLLAACGSGPPDNTAQAVCQRQAYDDPKVKHLVIESMGTSSLNTDVQFNLNQAVLEATNSCLRQKGVAVRGGVEAVRRN